MSFSRVFSFNNVFNCRNVLCTRNVLNTCREQKAFASNRMLEKLGIPLPPKRPLTPYFRFLQEIRPKVIQEDPNVSSKEVMKRIAAEWRYLDDEKKKKYQEEYNLEKQSYSVIYGKYKATITPEHKELIKVAEEDKKYAKEQLLRTKQKKALGKPKKPVSAFFLYVMEKKSEKDNSIKYSEWIRNVSQQWNNLSENVKEQYKQKARENLEKYQTVLLNWESEMIKEGHTDVIRTKEYENFMKNQSS